MNEELKGLIDALSAQHGWIAMIISIMGASRIIAKPIGNALQDFMAKAVAYTRMSSVTDDDALVLKITGSAAYRFFAFLVDWTLSIKLPTSDDVRKALAAGPSTIVPTLLIICAITLGGVAALATSGCHNTGETVLQAGGAYSDLTVAKVDREILDANKAMLSYVAYYDANSAFLDSALPAAGDLARVITASRKEWIREAYRLRDAYFVAVQAYKIAAEAARDRVEIAPDASEAEQAAAQEVKDRAATLNGTLAFLTNVTQQIADYRSAHAR